MSQFKECEVVMLPSNEKAKLCLSKRGNLQYLKNNSALNSNNHFEGVYQNIYITSDDEIKEGDWAILKVSNKRPLYCVKIKTINNHDKTCTVEFTYDKSTIEVFISGCKKIIATTDSSLKLHTVEEYPLGASMDVYKNLPQPSQSFIEVFVREFNKGNVITDVLVECEGYHGINTSIAEVNMISGDGTKNWKGLEDFRDFKIKVNPKDNTITIKKVKNSWNRNELIEKLRDMHLDIVDGNYSKGLNKWIEENL